MKRKLFVSIIGVLCAFQTLAQPASSFFNTTSGPWFVSQGSIFGTYNNALPTGPVNGFWCPNQSSYGWITWPFYTCPQTPPNFANHGCLPGFQDLYFRIDFVLPANAVNTFAVDWDVWADNSVMGVYVNNTTSSSWAPGSGAFTCGGASNFRWCRGWVPGNNFIIVHVRSGPGSGTPNGTDFVGLMINSKPVSPLNISGPLNVCALTGGHAYSVPPVPGATSYQWSLPGFTSGGGSTSNLTTGSAGGAAGNYTILVTAQNGTACLGTGTLAVTIMPLPTINIVANPNPICPGAVANFTASGALTYSWTAPFPTTSPPVPVAQVNSPIVSINAGPTVATVYKVFATDANGCKNNSAINILIHTPPTIGITAVPAVICAGQPNLLTASGGITYTWVPSGSTGLNLTVNPAMPPPNATYSVIGTAAVTGCTNTGIVTLTAGNAIPVNATNVTLCTDVAPCKGINASSNFTPVNWSWQPVPTLGPTLSNPTVCPTVSTIYTVTASSSLACSTTETLAVTVQTCCPPPVETFNIIYNPMCNLTLTNLAQYASTTGTFSGPGIQVNGNDFNLFQTLPPGNHTIAFTYTTAPWGCSYTLYQTVTILPPIVVYSHLAYPCIYDRSPTNFTAWLLNNTGYPTSYTWQPGNLTGQTIAVTPTANTIYTVTAVSAGCVASGTAQAIMLNTCCPQVSKLPVLSNYNLTAGLPTSTLGGGIIINSDLTLTGAGNFTLRAGDFLFNNNVKLIVDPNVNLVLEDAHLYGCNNMWTGIVVKNGANVTATNNPLGLCTMIEDAYKAIDANNIASGCANPLLNLDGVVFNRNNYAISLTNSTLTSIPVLVKSCVFTCRDIPTSYLSWPKASTSPGGLRYSTNAATCITAPYLMNGYPLKYCKNGGCLPGAISIQNINTANGAPPSPGVDFSAWSSPNASEFNLFDYMQVSFYCLDASLTTYNNAFQNMGFGGVYAGTSGVMNARLSLSAPAGSNAGNRFWQNDWGASACWFGGWAPQGVWADDILEFDIREAFFRGSSSLTFGQGDVAIDISTNRYNNYAIQTNTFTNFDYGIYMDLHTGPFAIPISYANWPNANMWNWGGIFGGSLDIGHNLFSPEISTSSNAGGGLLGFGLRIGSPNLMGSMFMPSIWAAPPIVPNFIHENTFDRIENGMEISYMWAYPLAVVDNTVTFSSSPAGKMGIFMHDTWWHKSIRNNYMVAPIGAGTGPVYHMNLANNSNSLAVTCNTLIGGHRGFSFWGGHPGCSWMGNSMDNITVGLHLTSGLNGTWIGQQGSPGNPSGNKWSGMWSQFQTQVDPPSDAANSPLYVEPIFAGPSIQWPTNNVGSLPFTTNGPFPSLIPLPIGSYLPYSCPGSAQMRQSGVNLTGLDEQAAEDENLMSVYPNPSSGNITITSEDDRELLEITIADMTGKIVYHKKIESTEHSVDLHLAFDQGIYLATIRDNRNKSYHKKLIIEK